MTRKRFLVPTEHYEYSSCDEQNTDIISVPGVTLSGIVTLELIDAKTGRVKESHRFPNMIPTSFLDRIGGHWQNTIDEMRTYMGAGESGLGTSPSQSSLLAEVGTRTNSNGGFSDSNGYVSGSYLGEGTSGSYFWHKRYRVFTETQAVGNIREIGMFLQSSGGPMLFRTLVKDEITGLPITIVKTNLDQLRVSHEIRLYPPTHDDIFSGTFVIAESTHSYTASALDVENSSVWGWSSIGYNNFGMLYGLGRWSAELFAAPSTSVLVNSTGSQVDFMGFTGVLPQSQSYFPYISQSNYLDIQFVYEPAYANFGPGGIKGFGYGWSAGAAADVTMWQILVDPPIVKTDIQKFKITFRAHFSASSL